MALQNASTRRGILALSAAGVVVSLLPRPAGAQLSAGAQSAIDLIRKNRTIQEGRIALRAPAIAENGNAVPLTISVESPMTAADHVTRIHVFADKNPTPEVAVFHLTPASGRAQV